VSRCFGSYVSVWVGEEVLRCVTVRWMPWELTLRRYAQLMRFFTSVSLGTGCIFRTLLSKRNGMKTKLRGFSPQANYTDRATAENRRRLCQLSRIEGVTWSAQRIPTAVNLGFLDPEPLLFHSSSSSVILTILSWPRSISTTSQKIWYLRESNPGPLDL
jgi:hypothetical protein